MQCAIKQGATAASLIVKNSLPPTLVVSQAGLFKLHQQLAFASMEKGDSTALELFVKEMDIASLRKYQGNNYPPILARLAFLESDPKVADKLYSQALLYYKETAPFSVLKNAAEIKGKLKKWKAAERLYEKALLSQKSNPSIDILVALIKMKSYSKSWKEAHGLLTERLLPYAENILQRMC